MRLEAQEFEAFNRWQKQNEDYHACPMCQTEHWNEPERILVQHYPKSNPPNYRVLVSITCRTCFHVRFVDLKKFSGA